MEQATAGRKSMRVGEWGRRWSEEEGKTRPKAWIKNETATAYEKELGTAITDDGPFYSRPILMWKNGDYHINTRMKALLSRLLLCER